MQKYIFIFFVLTAAFLGCRSTQKPVQVEKGPERQVEVPKVDDAKKDAQKDQDIDQLFKTEEVVVTDMAVRERKVKNMHLQIFQLLSKSVAVGNFTTAKPDILPIPHNTEEYSKINDNVFLSPGTNPLSTFSIDVDAASYANVRRFLNSGQLPYKDAVRIEELVNYFNYDYEDPKGEHPFSVTTEVSQAPWNPDHKLVHIGLQGKKLDYEDMRPSNLVFLVDVSGSMKSPNKLSLLKSAFKLLVKNLDDRDRIAIVAYAGAAGLVLPSTPAKERSTILSALDKLEAGGCTDGGAGIKLAYKVAKENLIEDGNNSVILATDGDCNVCDSSTT